MSRLERGVPRSHHLRDLTHLSRRNPGIAAASYGTASDGSLSGRTASAPDGRPRAKESADAPDRFRRWSEIRSHGREHRAPFDLQLQASLGDACPCRSTRFVGETRCFCESRRCVRVAIVERPCPRSRRQYNENPKCASAFRVMPRSFPNVGSLNREFRIDRSVHPAALALPRSHRHR